MKFQATKAKYQALLKTKIISLSRYNLLKKQILVKFQRIYTGSCEDHSLRKIRTNFTKANNCLKSHPMTRIYKYSNTPRRVTKQIPTKIVTPI